MTLTDVSTTQTVLLRTTLTRTITIYRIIRILLFSNTHTVFTRKSAAALIKLFSRRVAGEEKTSSSLFEMTLTDVSTTQTVLLRTTLTRTITIYRIIRILLFSNTHTVFTRKSAAALIKFFDFSVRCLFEGGAYSEAALI